MRRRLAVAAVVLTAAAAVNAGTFGAADATAQPWWRALHRFDEPDPLVAALASSDRLRTRLDVAVALGNFAPESTVLIAGDDHGVWDRHALRFAGIGRAHVHWLGGDDVFLSGLAIAPEAVTVARGSGGPLGPAWRIVVAPESAPARAAATDEYVDQVLAGDAAAHASAPLTFVAVLSTDGTELVLVEASMASTLDGEAEPWR